MQRDKEKKPSEKKPDKSTTKSRFAFHWPSKKPPAPDNAIERLRVSDDSPLAMQVQSPPKTPVVSPAKGPVASPLRGSVASTLKIHIVPPPPLSLPLPQQPSVVQSEEKQRNLDKLRFLLRHSPAIDALALAEIFTLVSRDMSYLNDIVKALDLLSKEKIRLTKDIVITFIQQGKYAELTSNLLVQLTTQFKYKNKFRKKFRNKSKFKNKINEKTIMAIVKTGMYAPAYGEIFKKLHADKVLLTDKIIATIVENPSSNDATEIADALIVLTRVDKTKLLVSNEIIDALSKADKPEKFARALIILREGRVPLEPAYITLIRDYSFYGLDIAEALCAHLDKGKYSKQWMIRYAGIISDNLKNDLIARGAIEPPELKIQTAAVVEKKIEPVQQTTNILVSHLLKRGSISHVVLANNNSSTDADKSSQPLPKTSSHHVRKPRNELHVPYKEKKGIFSHSTAEDQAPVAEDQAPASVTACSFSCDADISRSSLSTHSLSISQQFLTAEMSPSLSITPTSRLGAQQRSGGDDEDEGTKSSPISSKAPAHGKPRVFLFPGAGGKNKSNEKQAATSPAAVQYTSGR